MRNAYERFALLRHKQIQWTKNSTCGLNFQIFALLTGNLIHEFDIFQWWGTLWKCIFITKLRSSAFLAPTNSMDLIQFDWKYSLQNWKRLALPRGSLYPFREIGLSGKSRKFFHFVCSNHAKSRHKPKIITYFWCRSGWNSRLQKWIKTDSLMSLHLRFL